MALPVKFSLINSKYNDFLYSAIGEEQSGMALSVMSALTRLDMDPWQEARRLAGLPEATAVERFAEMIGRLAPDRWKGQEATTIAARLVRLLPSAKFSVVPEVKPDRPAEQRRYLVYVAIGLAMLLAGMFVAPRLWRRRPRPRRATAPDADRRHKPRTQE